MNSFDEFCERANENGNVDTQWEHVIFPFVFISASEKFELSFSWIYFSICIFFFLEDIHTCDGEIVSRKVAFDLCKTMHLL